MQGHSGGVSWVNIVANLRPTPPVYPPSAPPASIRPSSTDGSSSLDVSSSDGVAVDVVPSETSRKLDEAASLHGLPRALRVPTNRPESCASVNTQHVPSQLLFDSVPDGQRSDVARCRERAARSHSPQGACRERLRARGAPGRRRRLRGGSAEQLSSRSKDWARALFAARVRGSSVLK